MVELGAFGNFHFLRPWWLLLLPLVALINYWLRLNSPGSRWRDVIAPHLLRHLTVGGERGGWFNPLVVSAVIGALAVIALAGPTWERRASPFARDEAGLVIALDLSASMDQTDVQPSRLERAKQKVEDLLKLRAGSRSALLVYAGSAHAVIPMTDDADIIRNFLGALETAMMPMTGKRAETVLPLADRLLAETGAPGTLLLITDGANEPAAVVFRDYFSGVAHQLLILGVGGTAPADEDTVRAPLDERGLNALASATRGHYQALTLDDTDVIRLNRRVEHHLLNADDTTRPWIDAGYYLCFPVVALYLLWFRRGWTLQWCLLACIGAGLALPRDAAAEGRFADLWATPDQQGRFYLERGDYLRAAQHFRDPMWKGIAYYLNEDFDLAVEIFSGIDTSEGLFNLANAWAHSRNYVYAVRTYDRVLARDPAHAGARRNRAIVQAIIDEINALSASQREEPGEQSTELGDEPLTAEGAERESFGPRELEQFTAEQILSDPALNDIWMRQIQQNPARFLAIKFQMQLLNASEGEPVRDE
jgi:Ca-activated chloride channel family protein